MSSDLPTGVVTFLLTDIEGSTQLWEVNEEAMAAALLRHDRLLDELARAGGGTVIKSKGEGDAVLAVFARASAAAQTAVAMQRTLAAEAWPAGLPLLVRMALHTGEAHERDGDYYGPTLNRAARLRALARGGQILLSQATAQLLADRVPRDAVLIDLGLRQLRGMSREERVFELSVPDLSWSRHAASSVDARPLPRALPATSEGQLEEALPPTPVEAWMEPSPRSFARAENPSPAKNGPGVLGAIPLPVALDAVPGAFFVGRGGEKARLDRAFASMLACGGRAVLVEGEPGIGKTALVADAARRAHADSARVLYGRCDEDLGLAYQPFAEALGHHVAHCPLDELRAHVASSGAYLALLAPELRGRLPTVPSPTPTDPEADRFRMFQSVVAVLHEASKVAPVVLVIDDLQWAAKPSLQLLRHVLRTTASTRLLVVGTFRHTDIGPDHPLSALLADLHRIPCPVDRIRLGGLDEPDVVFFVAAAAGSPPTSDARALAHALGAHTAGNPFFLGETVRHLREAGALTEDGWESLSRDGPRLGVAEGVREVVNRRLQRLSPLANRTLTLASVIGAGFDLEILEQVADLADRPGVLDALEDAGTAHIVMELGHGRYQFSHALVREALYTQLTATRRARYHRRVGEAIESLGEEGRSLTALAHHFAAAAPAGCAAKAADYAMAAAREAMSRADWDDAIARLRRGLAALDVDAPSEAARRCDVLTLLAEAWTRFFNPREASAASMQAVETARLIGAPDRLGRAAYWFIRAASATANADDMRVAAELAAESLAALGERLPAVRARILAVLARVQDTQGDDSGPTSRQALDLARQSGDAEAVGAALLTATGFVRDLRPTERLALADELVSAAPPGGWDGWRDGHSQRAMARLALGDRQGFEADRAACERLGIERRSWFFRWIAALWATTLALVDGRFTEVEELAERARGLTLQKPYELLTSVQLFRLHFERGAMGMAEAAVLEALKDLPQNPILRTMLAVALAESDRSAKAAEEYDAFGHECWVRVPWPLRPVAMAYCAELLTALEDEPRARSLYREFRVFAGQTALSGVASTCLGAVDRYLGMLASTFQRPDLAAAHYENAASLEANLESPPLAARTSYWRARALLTAGGAADVTEAVTQLATCRATAGRLGMASLAARADRALAGAS